MRGKDFRCLTKGIVITDCNEDCKDMVLSQAWKNIIGNKSLKEIKEAK